MKMGKKVREYKSGDFIFAKVKGYPAWPARVQRMNGKKYFVYFYGTGETANLPPNMIFDYAENKEKFLTKTVKRRDFNDGVKQIEYDFANNIPLEQVVGLTLEAPQSGNNTINTSANNTINDSIGDTTAADDSLVELNKTQNFTGIEDSDETGALIIDEGKAPNQKGRKSTGKMPAKETPKAKEAKTPRGRPRKEDIEEIREEEKKEEEIVSRSGRKIRPKRYIDEQTEENATLPSPVSKKRRGASPALDKEKNKVKEKVKHETFKADKNVRHFNAVLKCELEDLKEPFVPEESKDSIIIAYLPSGQYVGVKLFQCRPNFFKNDNARLQWDRQAALNALTLKMQLEKGQIPYQSVLDQLVMDLCLSDEERATLDKDRETEEKKSRVHFLKTEMKMIEIDTKIKTCLCLERADTEMCLKLLEELMDLEIKPLMLLKHPTCVETMKRMRAYVGNTPSWDLSEDAALLFTQHAHKIREQADFVYNTMKSLFTMPEGLSFWEFFMERVAYFQKVTARLSSDELLELVYEPIEMTEPTSHTMRSAVDASNEQFIKEEESFKKKFSTPAKSKKPNTTPSKPPLKRQSSRKQYEEKAEDIVKLEQNEDVKSKVKIFNSTEEKDKGNEEKKDKEVQGKDIHDYFKEKPLKKEFDEDNTEEAQEYSDGKNYSKFDEKIIKQEKIDEKDKSIDKDKSTDKDKNDKDKKKEEEKEKEKSEDEPRAKRSRDSKKSEPPPRSPTKRKSKLI